jgi:hypothetical protein
MMLGHMMQRLAKVVRGLITSGGIGLVFLFAFSAVGAEPQTSDKASNGRFTGIALVTSDLDWFDKFQRPETPQIKGKSSFGPGESGAIVTLFSNAEVRNGRVRVECQITAFQPEKERRTYPPGPCYDGPARPDNVLYPSLLDLRFSMGEDEPAGISGFDIVMRDLHSGRSVKLRVSFLQGQTQ